MYGPYNEYTGNREDGSFYCKKCGWQVPVGFRHYHADELLKKLREHERVLDQLAEKTFTVQHNRNCPSAYWVQLAGKGRGRIDLKPRNQTAGILAYGKTLCEAAAVALQIQEKQRGESPAFTDACK